ncbi:hypothetical protein UT300005_06860 [Clostridium sp. CTA-5]
MIKTVIILVVIITIIFILSLSKTFSRADKNAERIFKDYKDDKDNI